MAGVYRHGLTLLGKGREVMYLTCVEKPGPYTVFVLELEPAMSRFQSGQQAGLGDQLLQIPGAGVTIDLYPSTPFAGIPFGILAEKEHIRAALRQIAGLVHRMQLSASDCLNAYLATAHQLDIPPAPTRSLASDPLQRLVVDFLAMQKSGDDEKLAAVAFDLLGLGPGLTPAGDDFLAGWLAALIVIYAQPFGEQLFPQTLIETILSQAARRTHQLSSALIWAAAQGEFDPTLKQILVDLLSGKPIQAGQLTQLAQTGFSSGLDGLAGALCLLEYYLFRS